MTEDRAARHRQVRRRAWFISRIPSMRMNSAVANWASTPPALKVNAASVQRTGVHQEKTPFGYHERTDEGIAHLLQRGLVLVVDFERPLHENLIEWRRGQSVHGQN